MSPRDAFLHVIYDYRYLALAGGAWALYGPEGRPEAQQKANELLPGIGVVIQDSLLLHSRSLIDFYTKGDDEPTDITLSGFGLDEVDRTLRDELANQYKHAIEVHLLHLTAWRDVNFRTLNSSTIKGSKRGRPDWNRDNTRIVDKLLEALEEVSKQTGDWQQPFTELYSAAMNLYKDPAFGWPKKLGDKPEVDSYLSALGL